MNRTQIVSIALIVLVGTVSLVLKPWGNESMPFYIGVSHPEHQCLPWDLFWVRNSPPDSLEIGDMIIVEAEGLEPFIEDGFPLAKLVAGLPGDTYRSGEDGFFVNGERYDDIRYAELLEDGVQRSVEPGEVLLVGVTDVSIDSRYFGAFRDDRIVGSARPLLARRWDTTYHDDHAPEIVEKLAWIFDRRDARRADDSERGREEVGGRSAGFGRDERRDQVRL